MEQPKIGIVTVLYKSANVLKEFFESLDALTYKNFIIYIIDNASPDNSVELCRQYTKDAPYETRIIETGENGGIARGNNVGIELALADGCDLVLLSNNDIEFSPDTLDVMISSMKEHKADMIVPKLFNYYTGRIAYAGGGFDSLKFPNTHHGWNTNDREEYNEAKFVDFAPTCFMLIRSKVFEEVGLMDERYFVYFDDTDFVWRAIKQHNKTLYYEPRVVIQHKEGNSSGSTYGQFSCHMDFRNMAYFMNKYFPWYRRYAIFSYQLGYHILRYIRHPKKYKDLGNPISYYREGLGLYKEWLKHGNLKK